MVELTITPAIVSALEYLDNCDQSNADYALNGSFKDPAVGNPVSHGQVIALSKALRKWSEDTDRDTIMEAPLFHLDDLLRGSRIYIEPPKPKTEPTSEYKALMVRLRREEEDRAYERMINPPLPAETFAQRFPSSNAALFATTKADIDDDDEVSYADVNRQMALIINILVSIVACSVAIWLAARHWSTPSRLGLSMGGSGMIGVAEVVVYAGYLQRVKEAKEKGKKQVEIKEILKTWVIGGEEEKKSPDISIPTLSKGSQDNTTRKRKTKSR